MTKKRFNAAYKTWIKRQLDDGRDPNGVFKVLLDQNYDYETIRQAMQFTPTVPVEDLVNPYMSSDGRHAGLDPLPDAPVKGARNGLSVHEPYEV